MKQLPNIGVAGNDVSCVPYSRRNGAIVLIRTGATAILLAALLGTFLAWKPPDSKLSAEELTICDKEGNVLIRLGSDDEGPCVVLRSKSSLASVTIRLREGDRPELKICDGSGSDRIALKLDKDNVAIFQVSAADSGRSWVVKTGKKDCVLQLRQENSNNLFEISNTSNGSAEINFRDESGGAGIELGADSPSTPTHLILTSSPAERAGEPEARLHLRGDTDKPTLELRRGDDPAVWSSEK